MPSSSIQRTVERMRAGQVSIAFIRGTNPAYTLPRTANFAGLVLLAITVVAFLMSPGTVLLSMALGMSVVTVLSMIGAILVALLAVGIEVAFGLLTRAARHTGARAE